MPLHLEGTKLYQQLFGLQKKPLQQSNAKAYVGSLEVAMRVVPRLLERISNTYPHYTSHAVDHSVTIVDRVGRLLPESTLKKLTPTEIYILITAAMLHDVGMVVPESEYREIEAQDTFRSLRDDGKFTPFFEAAEKAMLDGDVWAAAINRRFLIAEWVRRRHAERSGDFILELPPELAMMDLGDQRLRKAISDVARAHGFYDRQRILDEECFPRNCLIRNDEVDLGICACLLRVGDLLDLDSERACPLIRSVSEPLPGDSPAHWGRHERIEQLTINPKEIRVVARCENQDEHALLHGWCNVWLHDEIAQCAAMAAPSERIRFKVGLPKIDIQPRVPGSYEFREYHFNLDDQEVFDRLFGERLYGERFVFLRELLQNAVDATRCKLMDDVNSGRWDTRLGIVSPEQRPRQPRDVPLAIRQQYPLRTSLRQKDDLWVLEIEDSGLGMEHNTIKNYLLKVGRSYYRSSDFRSRYQFKPISEFGIGILSCFMVADAIEVETLREGSPDGPIHLTLPPWKRFATSRPGSRSKHGTTIRMNLNSVEPLERNPYRSFLLLDHKVGRPIPESAFGRLIQSILRHVEFPVQCEDDRGSCIVTDPWETEVATDTWQEIKPNMWVSGESWRKDTGSMRLFFGNFEDSDPAVLLSKEGIAVTADGNETWARVEFDFRGPGAPPLTLDRLRFSDRSDFGKRPDCRFVVSSIRESILGGSNPPLQKSIREFYFRYGSDRLLADLADVAKTVWVRTPSGFEQRTLAEAIETFDQPISLSVQMIPRSPVKMSTYEANVIIPLYEERRDSWRRSASLIYSRRKGAIAALNGYRVVGTDKDWDMLELDTGDYDVIHIADSHWLLAPRLVQRLRRTLEVQETGMLPPFGSWDGWGATLHLSKVWLSGWRDNDWPTGPPPRTDLRGAEFVMVTLKQWCPELPDDFIVANNVVPKDRQRSFHSDFVEWINAGMLDRPNWM